MRLVPHRSISLPALSALLVVLGPGCSASDPAATPPDLADGAAALDAAPPPLDLSPVDPLDVVVPVPPTGPYGKHTFRVPAAVNWVNTGLYLKAGQSARVTASGTWTVKGMPDIPPEGDETLGVQRTCAVGSFVLRTGLGYEDALACMGAGGTFTAAKDGIVYAGMVPSTDLGEAYGTRLDADGALDVTLESDGATVPVVPAADLATFDATKVASGWVELRGRHVLVTVPAAIVTKDAATAFTSLQTLDAIYEVEAALRGMAPFSGQRIRFYPDERIRNVGYMLAGNPIRVVPEVVSGTPVQRILRASDDKTDIWGFAHEMGHTFSFANGAWVYQSVNLESWPNVFTLRALTELQRTANQPNVATYCKDKDSYLASGEYAQLAKDPFLQLCFLMEFTRLYDWGFWARFFKGMNSQTNADVKYDGKAVDLSVWSYVRDRFSLAAGVDVTPTFKTWRVPVR